MDTEQTATSRCIGCAWRGQRTKRGHLPAHKQVRPVPKRRGDAPTAACRGPVDDLAIATSLGRAFYVAGQTPMPDPRTLTVTAPADHDLRFAADLYRAAPAWARWLVTVLPCLRLDDQPGDRVTVRQYFADRMVAEEWARACALALGPAGSSARTHGYVTVAAMDTRHRRREALASTASRRDACGLESPVAYTAIDPGGVVVRFTDPANYPGYGDTPARSMWESFS